jgi:hypothetical protein
MATPTALKNQAALKAFMDSIDDELNKEFGKKMAQYANDYNFNIETEKDIVAGASPSTGVSLSNPGSFVRIYEQSPESHKKLPKVRSDLSTPVKLNIIASPV